MVLGSAACAAACTRVVTSDAIKLCTVAGGVADVREPTIPPQPPITAASAAANPKAIPLTNCGCVSFRLRRPMRCHCFGNTEECTTQGGTAPCAGVANKRYRRERSVRNGQRLKPVESPGFSARLKQVAEKYQFWHSERSEESLLGLNAGIERFLGENHASE